MKLFIGFLAGLFVGGYAFNNMNDDQRARVSGSVTSAAGKVKSSKIGSTISDNVSDVADVASERVADAVDTAGTKAADAVTGKSDTATT